MKARRRNVNEQHKASVLALSSADRYRYAIRSIVDWGFLWALKKEDWAWAADDDGAHVFPIWPSPEFAEICAIDEWADYNPVGIPLEEILGTFLSDLQSEGEFSIAVLPTPDARGVVVSLGEFEQALRAEQKNYL
jgi:hypothetical protein